MTDPSSSTLYSHHSVMAFSSFTSTSNRPKTMTTMAFSQLLTPEEHLVDSFDRKSSQPSITHTVPSPPESPAFNSFTHHSSTPGEFHHHDRILYPDHDSVASTQPERPLFDASPVQPWPYSDQRHDSPHTDRTLSSPQPRCDSPFSSHLGPAKLPSPSLPDVHDGQTNHIGPVALNNRWGSEYYRFMMAQLEDHRAQMMAHRRLPPVKASYGQNRDRYTQQQVSSLGRSVRVEKLRPIIKTPVKSKATKPATLPKLNESSTKRSRRQHMTPDRTASPQTLQSGQTPKPRTRAAPSKRVDDKDYSEWADIPDRCPPVSSLDQPGKKLSAHWNNSNSLDLSNDPDRHHLHPQELEVASTLRLKCNQYLASKRRIFAAKVKALQEGKEFNKTSAQNCCSIDVNKASRLWMAFDGVGWFDARYFQQWT